MNRIMHVLTLIFLNIFDGLQPDRDRFYFIAFQIPIAIRFFDILHIQYQTIAISLSATDKITYIRYADVHPSILTSDVLITIFCLIVKSKASIF